MAYESNSQCGGSENFETGLRCFKGEKSCYLEYEYLEAAVGIEPLNKGFAEILNRRSQKIIEGQGVIKTRA
jgi:hypothetical protein